MTATLLLCAEAFAGTEAVVEGEAYRHLFRARRLAVGARLRVVDGRGAARWAEVAAVDRRRGRLQLGEAAPANDPCRHLELLVAPPRPQRASWLVEKATELGVAAVRFIACERAVREPGDAQLDRLERVAAAALEQSGGARLPQISGLHPWDELPRLLDTCPERWFFDLTGEEAPVAAGLPSAPSQDPAPVALLVGPEGGWSEPERADLVGWGARPRGLGRRVLRVETAAVVGAALALLA